MHYGYLCVLVGAILVCSSILVTLVRGQQPPYIRLSLLFAAFGFVGFLLLEKDSITHIEISKLGSVDQVVDKIKVSAKTVEDLKTRVENQSATVDAIARQSADAEALSKSASLQATEARKKLEVVNELVEKASSSTLELNKSIEFANLVLEAESDDRTAFDTLVKIGADASDQRALLAQKVTKSVSIAHSNPISYSYPLSWQPGVDPSKRSFDEIVLGFQSLPDDTKIGVIQYLGQRDDFSKIQRLDFIFAVFNTDKNLRVVEYAGRVIDSLTQQKFIPIPTSFLDEWWSKHRSEYISMQPPK